MGSTAYTEEAFFASTRALADEMEPIEVFRLKRMYDVHRPFEAQSAY